MKSFDFSTPMLDLETGEPVRLPAPPGVERPILTLGKVCMAALRVPGDTKGVADAALQGADRTAVVAQRGFVLHSLASEPADFELTTQELDWIKAGLGAAWANAPEVVMQACQILFPDVFKRGRDVDSALARSKAPPTQARKAPEKEAAQEARAARSRPTPIDVKATIAKARAEAAR